MIKPSPGLQTHLDNINARLEEIRKAEKPVGKMPTAGKSVDDDEGSGGQVKKGKTLSKETTCSTCNGTKLVKGSACKSCSVVKDEVPMAKPPSGKNPAVAVKPPTASPKVGGTPPAPNMGKEELPPKKIIISKDGQAMGGATQRIARFHQIQQARQKAQARPTSTTQALQNIATARDKILQQANVTKSELLNGAAHHLNGLNWAVRRQDNLTAERHANLCVAYQRLLGEDPLDPSKEILIKSDQLVKNESGFVAFPRDIAVEVLFKALLGALPKDTTLDHMAKPASLPGVKAPGAPAANMKTAGQAYSLATPATFSKPKPVVQQKPNQAGSVLAGIRQRIFGSKTSAVAHDPK